MKYATYNPIGAHIITKVFTNADAAVRWADLRRLGVAPVDDKAVAGNHLSRHQRPLGGNK